MQDQGAIPFGPFTYNGTNCCRFVRTGILSGNPKLSPIRKFLLEFLWHLNPTPITNVNLLQNKAVIPTLSEKNPGKHHSLNAYTRETVHGTLPQPERHSNIPPNSQWLAGEVSGYWFHLVPEENGYRISRFSPEGIEECNGIFSLSNPESFDPEKNYEFIHLSHCSKVHILQMKQILEFKRTS